MPFMHALWWLGATSAALTVPVVLPSGETSESWRHALSLCTAYKLTPSPVLPSAGPMVQIRAISTGWALTVRDERGAVTTINVDRRGRERPNDDAATLACSLLRPTSDASANIPLPTPESPPPPPPPGPYRPKSRAQTSAKATKPVTPPTPPPALPVADARGLAPGEQLDGLMPVGAAAVCACAWITDDSDLRSDFVRWSFAPDCGTCEPTTPLEIREEDVDRRFGGRR